MQTRRLILRQWRSDDLPAFAKLNSDPDVMEYFPALLSIAESDQLADRIQTKLEEDGWGLWAIELAGTNEFIGFVGLNQPSAELPCSPCTEIGWRLAKRFWGRGFATEAGRCALNFGFDQLQLDEIVSFTSVGNGKSRAVMERLGLQNTGENFLHPSVPAGSDLQDHVLYKITNDQWHDVR